MDEYTRKTKSWLDWKFSQCDEKGIYISHAPIYGFSRKHIFLGLYKNNFAILKEIEKISSKYLINNFLEVGSAEGYTAHLAESIFGFNVIVVDLSYEAIKKAMDIYHLRGIVADAQALEFIKTDSFDLVLCSETLEHLSQPQKAFGELLRIAKKALIITVPAAKDRREKEDFMPSKEPHSHLNIFTKEDLRNFGFCNLIKGISFKWLDKIESLFTMDGKSTFYSNSGLLKFLYKFARFLFSPLRRFYGTGMARLFIKLDYWLGSAVTVNAITYLAVYLKAQPDFDKKIKSGDILELVLNKDKVAYKSIA